MFNFLSHYKRLEKPIFYIIVAEFFVQLVNVTFMNVQPLYMESLKYSDAQISQITAFRFLGVVLLALPLGFLIIGKKVKKLFVLSSILVPLFGLWIIYAIYSRNMFMIYASQFCWGASFTFIQIPIIPFIMRNAKKENHTAAIALSYATWSFGGIASGILIYLMDAIDPHFFDEKMVIIIICLLSFAGTFFLFAARLDEKVVAKRKKNITTKKYDWNLIIKALIPTLIIAVGAGLSIPLISLFFKKIHHLDKGAFAPVSTAAAILVAWAAVMVPVIKKKIGYRFAIPFTQGMAVLSLAAMATTELFNQYTLAVILAVIFYLLRQPLMNVAGPMTSEVTMNYVGKHNREIVSVFTSAIWSGSWFLSLLASAFIFNMDFSFVHLFLLTAVLYAIGVFWYNWLLIDYGKREKAGLIEKDGEEGSM
jgi:MFS family permease